MECGIDNARTHRKVSLTALALLLGGPTAEAGMTFGIYDARAMAMGGTVAAAATNDNAQFYNAALLAFNDEIEERTRDSRFLLPIVVPQVSKSALDVESIASDGLADELSRAIAQFNGAQDAASAAAAADAADTLNRNVAALSGDDLFGDVYLGLAITEPGKFQGAAFFLGTRFVLGGVSQISDADLATLGAYVEGLRFIASGGAEGVSRPELFAADGTLQDPLTDLESTAVAAGVAVTEVGVAMSSMVPIANTKVAAGVSLKMLEVDTFEDVERLVDDRLDVDRNEESTVRFNFDLGLAKDLGERWRIGVAVKDVIPYNYETALGTKIRLRPRPRLGVAYEHGRMQLAADVDLLASETFAGEDETHEAALGAEWNVAEPLRLRAGLSTDLRGSRALVASAGVGVVWRRLAVDIAFADGSDQRSAALQFGLVF